MRDPKQYYITTMCAVSFGDYGTYKLLITFSSPHAAVICLQL